MTRRRLRSILLLAGILPALLAFVVLMKVAVMMGHDRNGRGDFADGDLAAAADHFAANHSWNWFEPWVAPFDQGAARHAAGEYDDAIGHYEEALESVPRIEECRVRINIALAHEALGDEIVERGVAPEQAFEKFQDGIAVLTEGDCPDDAGTETQAEDATSVVDRLRGKDSDGDGLTDTEELTGSANHGYGNEPTDPTDPDSDDDQLTDGAEVDEHGTDPNVADTDEGGVPDGSEVDNGGDPLDPADDEQQGNNSDQQQDGQTPQEEELEERNQEGRDDRREQQDGDGGDLQPPGGENGGGGTDPGEGGTPDPKW